VNKSIKLRNIQEICYNIFWEGDIEQTYCSNKNVVLYFIFPKSLFQGAKHVKKILLNYKQGSPTKKYTRNGVRKYPFWWKPNSNTTRRPHQRWIADTTSRPHETWVASWKFIYSHLQVVQIHNLQVVQVFAWVSLS